jgi:hypothetical protein
MVEYDPIDGQTLTPHAPQFDNRASATVLNVNQAEHTIPIHIPPGNYRVTLRQASPEGVVFPPHAPSSSLIYKVRPYRFAVNFLDFHCLDESNEGSPHDEIVTIWGYVADNEMHGKTTGEYVDVDAGETHAYKPGDRVLFTGEVRRAFLFTTQLYEWDDGDIHALNEVLGFVSDIAGEVAKLAIVAAPVAAAIAGFVAVFLPFLQKLIAAIGNGPDQLGQQDQGWLVQDLQAQTDNPQRKISGQLPFINSDSEGSHIVHYEVVRLED